MSFTLDQKVIFSARAGNLELTKERIDAGGNVNCHDPKHGTALTAAITTDNVEMIEFLIQCGADVNAHNEHGLGPLEVALRNPNQAIVKVLAWSGAKLNKKSRRYYAERLEACLATS